MKDFLCPILSSQELYIIYQKHIDSCHFLVKSIHFIGSESCNDLLNELGCGEVNYDFIWEVLHNFISYCLHKVRLPQSYISIEKKGVIRSSWSCSYGFGSGKSHLICGSCNEGIKTIFWQKKNTKILIQFTFYTWIE